MGMFATFTFAEGHWSVQDEPDESGHPSAGTFLSASVHDSDFASITYEPGPAAGGLTYLGFQPRDYFEDTTASEDVDLDAQAEGLATWAKAVTGTPVSAADIRPLLAEALAEEPADDFVEETLQRLIVLLGLPVPVELLEG